MCDRRRIISLSFDKRMSPIRMVAIINCFVQAVYFILQLLSEMNNVTERVGYGRTSMKSIK